MDQLRAQVVCEVYNVERNRVTLLHDDENQIDLDFYVTRLQNGRYCLYLQGSSHNITVSERRAKAIVRLAQRYCDKEEQYWGLFIRVKDADVWEHWDRFAYECNYRDFIKEYYTPTFD